LRILAASDIHGNHETYRWLAACVPDSNVEAVVLAGDLLGIPDGFASVEEAQRADARWICALLAGLPASLPVFYVMGNDDWTNLDPPPGHIQSLHMTRRGFGDFNFVGYQYTLPFMGGVFEKPETEIREDLLALGPLVDDRTVLVTHGPSAGILDSTRLGPAGSTALGDFVLRHRVRAHIHGHIHGSFGRIDNRFNVAAGRERRAMIIDLAAMKHDVLI
jgi:Icc-related predicted phosphoesterase